MRRVLIERARTGDRAAFASLASDSIGRLFNVAQLMLRDRDLAEDAVQETLVLAWRDLRGLRDVEGFDSWLHRILVRCVYREARRARASGVGILDVSDMSSATDSAAALADRDQLDRGFQRLRAEHRAVIVLHYYLGYSDDEAAAVLAVPIGTIKSRLNRAASALRSQLEADARTGDPLAMESIR